MPDLFTNSSKFKTFHIFLNEYCRAQNFAHELHDRLQNLDLKNDENNPDLAIIVGGDGTFLQTIHKLSCNLSKVYFLHINAGSLGFYSTFNLKDMNKILKIIQQKEIYYKEFPLIEANFNNNQIAYAINEIKIVNHIKTMKTNIYINSEILEVFRGSGLIFCTASGSTGYMRSISGAILLTGSTSWEMKELAPINNASFSTINSPIILNESMVVDLKNCSGEEYLVCDTFHIKLENGNIKLKISDTKCRLIYDQDTQLSNIAQLRTVFSLGA